MNQQLGICTISMGWHKNHALEEKIKAAQKVGIKGLELNIIDLNRYAVRHNKSPVESAKQVSKLCRDSGVQVFALGPFEFFEGSTSPLDKRLVKAAFWIQICKELGCTVVQVPSNFEKDARGEEEVLIGDLQKLADLCAKQSPPISIAYEALAWGKHVADWEESLRIVNIVNRPNFGLCLDTYHVLARVWADPRNKSGVRPGAAAALRDTIQRFRDTCPAEKIVYIQLCDGEFMDPPFSPSHSAHNDEHDVLFQWCMWGRVFPLEVEAGAYFPLEEILRAWLIERGWKGWVSMETFHRTMYDEDQVPDVWAKRAVLSWDRITNLLSKN